MSNNVVVQEPIVQQVAPVQQDLGVRYTGVTAGFSSWQGFELLQRMAKMFNESSLVPPQFKGKENFGNCVIAMNMAQRMNADPLMVMQNLYVVYGNPAWSSKFLIATFNQCGRFSSIHYKETGKPNTDSWGCIAWAQELATGEVVEGPEVTIATAKAEGWYSKNGSKWQSMPQQMLRYRAASWFIRTTAPELSMGLQTREEAEDIGEINVTPPREEIAQNANSQVFEPEKPAPAIQPAKKISKEEIEAATTPVKAEVPKTKAKKTVAAPAAQEGPDF